jgi:hypothetical protein
MSNHAHAADASHGSHEQTDFEGNFAIWAVPFSLVLLFGFVLIVTLWVPSAVTREMKVKELQGAEAGTQSLLLHRAHEAEAMAAGEGRIPVEEAMAAVVREGAPAAP